MRFSFTPLLLVVWLCPLAACAQKQHQHQTLALAFYNLENLFDTQNDPRTDDDDFTPNGVYQYTQAIYRQKLHNIATVLAQLGAGNTPDGPAIIGVAEVENGRVLADLLRQPEIAKRQYKYVWFEGNDPRGIDVALIYHPKYFRVLGARPHPVTLLHNGRREKTRDILLVSGILMGDTVHILVNHWPSRREGAAASAPKRAAVAAINRKAINAILAFKPRSRIIVMGDLNDDPTDPSVAQVLGANGNKNEVKMNGLYNPWTAVLRTGTGSAGYDNKWNLFDQIILSGAYLQAIPNRWRYSRAEVFNKAFLRRGSGKYKNYPQRSFSGYRWLNGYSDHFPTLVYLTK